MLLTLDDIQVPRDPVSGGRYLIRDAQEAR